LPELKISYKHNKYHNFPLSVDEHSKLQPFAKVLSLREWVIFASQDMAKTS
jgi:hypothetical protein